LVVVVQNLIPFKGTGGFFDLLSIAGPEPRLDESPLNASGAPTDRGLPLDGSEEVDRSMLVGQPGDRRLGPSCPEDITTIVNLAYEQERVGAGRVISPEPGATMDQGVLNGHDPMRSLFARQHPIRRTHPQGNHRPTSAAQWISIS
jgi:hypothetical protein